MKCIKCGSYAINEGNYDRVRGVDSDLCDVHYWMKRAARITELEALTQISADDVTDEMVKKFLETTPFCDGTVKESIAAAYNAVIENRSEAR